MSAVKRDLDDFRPALGGIVHGVLGFSEPTLVTAALNCLNNGYDRSQTIGIVKHIGYIFQSKSIINNIAF